MNIFENIVIQFKNLKKNDNLSREYLVVIKVLYDCISKERLAITPLRNITGSMNFKMKIIYSLINLKFKDEKSKYLKSIMPNNISDAIKAIIKPLAKDVKTTLEEDLVFFEERALSENIIKHKLDIWGKTMVEKPKTKKTKAKTTPKSFDSDRTPYVHLIYTPMGGQNKRYKK